MSITGEARSAGGGPSTPLAGSDVPLVIKGDPTDEELGAVAAVLAAVTAESGPYENEDRQVPSGWKSYWRVVRQPLIPAHEGWRGSLR